MNIIQKVLANDLRYTARSTAEKITDIEENSSENNSWKEWAGGLLLIGLVLLLWYGSWVWIDANILSSVSDESHETARALFGDKFGGVNALFSALAFAGIIFTIFLQRKELQLQRDELRETRGEFQEQNKTLRLQRFENTFFNLLNLHHKIVEGIDFDSHVEKKDGRVMKGLSDRREYELVAVKGRDVFKQKFEVLARHLPVADEQAFNQAYMKIYGTVQTDFGHYFRNLYRIIKLVHETEFVTENDLDINFASKKRKDIVRYEIANYYVRYKYTSMIRAQLSDYELLWIFYNCLSKNGVEKFKPLIEDYSLLKNLPPDKLHSQDYVNRYRESAYKKKYE